MPFACPTNQAVVPSPIIRYPVGNASNLDFFTPIAANACAPVIKYGFSELSNDINKIASALGETPVTFPGNNITGIVIVVFICDIIFDNSI
jgi:hypothetical protein